MSHRQDLESIIRDAGAYMLGSTEKGHTQKSNVKDFVTVADIKAQNIIIERLSKLFPGKTVLSEEHSEAERAQLYEPQFSGFVIDPIDGTYNFKRGMRESAISVGYIEKGKPLFGAVYDPYKDELYWAEYGKGAELNGSPIHVSNQASLAGASVATSNSYNDEAMARNLRRHLGLYEVSAVMPWTNCPGSGVLIMTNVACGRFDLYHHNGLKPWDNAAAFLLVREAGGVVHTLNGEDAAFTSETVVMGNPEMVGIAEAVFAKLDKQLLS